MRSCELSSSTFQALLAVQVLAEHLLSLKPGAENEVGSRGTRTLEEVLCRAIETVRKGET